MIGKTVGHYEITGRLGKGGMGEVFRAKDRKLGRDVAVKVLPEEFARDSDRVARFQREAKLLASLNHPNIAAIYGLEESGQIDFLVLELVEGETLADQIKRGPISVEDSLKLALQITEALEAAHEKGIIHRDLKPANIKVTPDGKVKVLDFGLAKAFAGEQQELNLSNSPTLSNAATQAGVILGTAAYMSPEQARGKAVDKRADIWAFGCVLYEMLAGQAAWSGATVTDIIAASLAKDPDFTKLPLNLHPRIRALLDRCLQKDPMERYRDAGDVRVEIKHILADPGGVSGQSPPASEPRPRMRRIWPWAAASLVLGLAIAAATIWKLRPPEQRPVTRFTYELPQGQQFGDVLAPALAISPDGRQFAYSTQQGIYLKPMDELSARLIPGTEGPAATPFFSPDGKWIGYWSQQDSKLKKIPVAGGMAATLCDITLLASASWRRDNTIYYTSLSGDLMRVSADGGLPKNILKLESVYSFGSQILPDGDWILYTANFFAAQPKAMVQSLKSGERRELLQGASARYLTTGHLVYSIENSIYAVPFDLSSLKVGDGAVPVVGGVSRGIASEWTVSDSGTLVYIPGTKVGVGFSHSLVWVDRAGKEEPIAAPPNPYWFPRISPDGTRIALSIGIPGDTDIWIWDLIRKGLTRLTFDGTSAVALWTPDGKRIAYTNEGENKVFYKAADGTGKSDFLAGIPDKRLNPWSWADNGKVVVLEDYGRGAFDNIGMLASEGDRKWKPLLNEKFAERQPQVSKNGRWLAYVSNESGKYEVYVRPFPDVGAGRWQVSTNGGENPLWSPDGRELFFRSRDAVMAVSVKTDPGFSYETPKILFQGSYFLLTGVVGTLWDISPDGKRFLMIKQSPGESGSNPKINVVLNWIDELKQRVPAK